MTTRQFLHTRASFTAAALLLLVVVSSYASVSTADETIRRRRHSSLTETPPHDASIRPSPRSTEYVNTSGDKKSTGASEAHVLGDDDGHRHRVLRARAVHDGEQRPSSSSESRFRGGGTPVATGEDNGISSSGHAAYYVRGSQNGEFPRQRQWGEHNWPLADAYMDDGGPTLEEEVEDADDESLRDGVIDDHRSLTNYADKGGDHRDGRPVDGSGSTAGSSSGDDYQSTVTETDMDVDLDIELPALLLLNDREAMEDLLGGIQIQLRDLINTLSSSSSSTMPSVNSAEDAGTQATSTVGDWSREDSKRRPSAESGSAFPSSEYLLETRQPPADTTHHRTANEPPPLLMADSGRPSQRPADSIVISHGAELTAGTAVDPAARSVNDARQQQIHIRESLHSHNKRTDTNGKSAAATDAAPSAYAVTELSGLSSQQPTALRSSLNPDDGSSGVSLLEASQSWVTDLAARTTQAAQRLPRWTLPMAFLMIILLLGAATLFCGCSDVNRLTDSHDDASPAAEPGPEMPKPGELKSKLAHYAAHPEDSPTVNSPRAVALERMKANLRNSRHPAGSKAAEHKEKPSSKPETNA